MSQEQAFLDQLAAKPGDDVTRLVYADWLEERGDPRADYLRLEIELAGVEEYEERHDPLEQRARELRAGLDPAWVERAGKRFDVVLFGHEPWFKITVIKQHREQTQVGLKVSKDQVEATPACLATALSRGEAERVRDRY